MKAIVRLTYFLGYELCITSNRQFSPCLTYDGPRFFVFFFVLLTASTSILPYFYLLFITYIKFPITVLLSHSWITETGASVV